jgi:hypothetical protein
VPSFFQSRRLAVEPRSPPSEVKGGGSGVRLKRHRSISTGWEQPVERAGTPVCGLDGTGRFRPHTDREPSGGAHGKPGDASESGTQPCGGRHLGCSGTRSSSRRGAGGGPSGRELRKHSPAASFAKASSSGSGVLVTSRVPGRLVKGVPEQGMSGAHGFSGRANHLTATEGARVDAGRGLPAPRARFRPSKRAASGNAKADRAPDSWSLGWSVPQGASPPGHGALRGQPPAGQPLRGGPVDRGSVGSRSCSRIAHRMQTSEGRPFGSSQEQASRKRVS